ncbi:MAG: RNA polymerase subunit sigma-70 [Candidatus Saccharimonas sp.]|nr:RNA polymerase subunit sigma-70 [Planctomycetaceae bacterium]
MNPDATVTQWIQQLKAGHSSAVQKIWEGYFEKMVRLARHRLAEGPRAAADEEDVALSAFDSFCRGAQAGNFPQLVDRDALWPLLVAITSHKLVDLRRREGRQKRGGGWKRLDAGDAENSAATLDELVSHDPTPQFACQMAEEFRRLLDSLGDETLQSIAVWRMEGESIDEIAARLNCVPRTVLRKLDRIRSIWSDAAEQDDGR